MNTHGNRSTPRFTSLNTKKRTKYRRKMLSEGAIVRPPMARDAHSMPGLAAMPVWFGRTLAAIARAREAIFSRAENASNRQRQSGRNG